MKEFGPSRIHSAVAGEFHGATIKSKNERLRLYRKFIYETGAVDATGNKVGNAIMVNEDPSGTKKMASISISPTGSVFVAWVESTLEEANGGVSTNNEGIYGRLFPAP